MEQKVGHYYKISYGKRKGSETFLRRSDSTLLTPVVSRFRLFSSAFKSITLSSDSLRTSAPSGTPTSVDGSVILDCVAKDLPSVEMLFVLRCTADV